MKYGVFKTVSSDRFEIDFFSSKVFLTQPTLQSEAARSSIAALPTALPRVASPSLPKVTSLHERTVDGRR